MLKCGALTPGTPAAVGYRVTFHLIVNLVVVFFALKAALAVRDARMGRDASSTGQRLDRVGYAVLAAPLAGVIFLLPVFGAHAGHGVAAAGDPAAIVATVNGTDITRGELDTAVALALQLTNVPQLGVATSDPNVQMSEEQVQIATLNRLVQNTLMEQGAADLGITIEDWEVQARKTELIETDFVTREAFDQFLADNNAPEEYATDQVRSLLLQEKVHATLTQDVVFTQEAIQGVYAEQYEGQPRARHLLTDSEAAANKFLTRAQDGENFPEMIRSETMDPRAASTAGYMGPVRQDAAVPEMVQALSGMQDGEYAVVQTQYGWHVVQRITPATLQEVETEIRDNLLLVQQANAGQEWLASNSSGCRGHPRTRFRSLGHRVRSGGGRRLGTTNRSRPTVRSGDRPGMFFVPFGDTGVMTVPARRFARDPANRMIAGVCAGIARSFGWPPGRVRLLFVLSCILPGPQILLYLVLWLLMPEA